MRYVWGVRDRSSHCDGAPHSGALVPNVDSEPMSFAHLPSAALVAAIALCGCDSAGDAEAEITVSFEAQLGGAPFLCTESYTGIGQSGASVRPLDFRLFIHDVKLIRAGGERVALELDEDEWQHDGVVLLDFEDASGTCATGSSGTNYEVRGRAPAGEYTGVEFTVGVPEPLNHLDGATAPAPLNTQGMWWSWAGGYKYMRLDLSSTNQPAFFFHLGSTACGGDPVAGFECTYGNLASIVLEGMDLSEDSIVVDGAAIFAAVDVDREDDPMDTLPGCMAFPGDPECPAMLGALGLGFEDAPSAGAQSLFSVSGAVR